MSKAVQTIGGAAELCNRIEFDPDIPINQIQGVMHHEMRHMKQNFYAVNYNPAEYIFAVVDTLNDANRELITKLSPEEQKTLFIDCLRDIKQMFNLDSFSCNNIPKDKLQYAKECLQGCQTYANAHENHGAYFKNFKEVDARHAGGLMDKLFQGSVTNHNRQVY